MQKFEQQFKNLLLLYVSLFCCKEFVSICCLLQSHEGYPVYAGISKSMYVDSVLSLDSKYSLVKVFSVLLLWYVP